jgi:pimeloyl-ACP methyl ester carboxylesterase
MDLLFTIIALLVATLLIFNHIGVRIREKGMRSVSDQEIEDAGQKHVLTDDGRLVAYAVYGSDQLEAPVVINMHGSALEAGFEKATYANICQALNVKGIAISLPGCGFTDQKPGRKVVEWANEDLAAVLKAEQVEQFHITGHSQGTPHAMAAALTYSDRVIGLALNAPLLPTALNKELGFASTLGTGQTPHSSSLKKYSMGWYFSVFRIVFGMLPSSVATGVLRKGFPKVEADKELVERFHASLKRGVVRGTSGSTWETAQDSCFDWGFDVRDLSHSNAFVWHADDDNTVPSIQGKWLAGLVGADHKHEAEGYGHLTYCAGQYQEPEKSIVAAMLSGASQT